MKIATWNVNSLRVRLEQVTEWLNAYQPDVLGLQEIKMVTEDFPMDAMADIGYKAVANGQKTYNGVALVAKTHASDVIEELPGLDDPQRRVLAASYGDTRVINLYVPNGQSVGSDKYEYKLNWLDRLHDFLTKQLGQYPNIVVMGDFNIAPEDRDVHDPQEWEGSVLVSGPERKALKRISDLGFVDVYRQFDQPEQNFSWWDYRAAGFRRNRGLRIDLILASTAMSESCTLCHIDKEPRAWERPSDHCPVVAQFDS